MKESLLQTAKSFKSSITKQQYTLEQEELCMAWLSGEISLQAVQYALKVRASGQVYVFLARCSRQIFLKAKPKK